MKASRILLSTICYSATPNFFGQFGIKQKLKTLLYKSDLGCVLGWNGLKVLGQ